MHSENNLDKAITKLSLALNAIRNLGGMLSGPIELFTFRSSRLVIFEPLHLVQHQG